ncbi:PTS sugar transporter subunit IIA [uncultured Mitsuokella sp.]|uniref:PTS sugar transporter subunit IIA n=1 Tax=uncultured Mitsuokella sp. TaxID=453120 RepID=UPI00260CD69B|nr:PTS sugar transporter subunit IIA [uncultured Mitsuokella sp.]
MDTPHDVHLSGLLNSRTVQAMVPAGNWEDAIRAGGKLLVQDGAITQDYVEAMIRNMKTLGPYIVIAPGIAMPHARPESGVKRLGVSLITLATPIPFGNPDNDPVSIVFCLAAPDENHHLAMMAEWVQLIADATKVSAIRQAATKEELLRVIASPAAP